MVKTQTRTQQFFRRKAYAYPWLLGAAILFAGAYILADYGYGDAAVIGFGAGLVVAAIGVNLTRKPAVRIAGRGITLSDPRGLSLRTRTYSLKQIKRVTIVTRHRNINHRMRGGVLMVNLSGVPAARIDVFVDEIKEQGIQVDR